MKILVLPFKYTAHLWHFFLNHNSDPVSLITPYSHNSGPILSETESTGKLEPGAYGNVFGYRLWPFSWEEIGGKNGRDFFLGWRKYIF